MNHYLCYGLTERDFMNTPKDRNMKIAISGYRGLIGQALAEKLVSEGHGLVHLDRESLYDTSGRKLTEKLRATDAVIHLAGAPILTRWTPHNREIIYNSRVVTTRNLVRVINQFDNNERPGIFVGGSAIGLYEDDLTHDETSEKFASHFAAEVIKDWKKASEELRRDVRRVIIRTGLVLDRKAMLVKMLKLPFLLYMGGPVGDGSQPMPFIHLDDETETILWLLKNPEARGIYNLTAPEQISNARFSKAFAHQLKRPSWFAVPAFALRMIYGEAAAIVVNSPAVIPARLQSEGFTFRFPTIDEALSDLLTTKKETR